MNNSSIQIKGLILPLIIKMSKGNLSNLSDDFWIQFANDFIHYEIDAQPIYTTLYKLELLNPEDVFEKLPQAYSSFISELAEEYVLGNTSEIIIKLLEAKNEFFLKEVTFLKTMKEVITKLERQKLKESLPFLNDRLVFELDEEILKQVAKKKAREDLKNKFKQWDIELDNKVNSETIKFSLSEDKESELYSFDNKIFPREEELSPFSTKKEPKVISLTWIKYATAACIVLTAGIMYFKFNTYNNFVQPGDTNVVTAPVKKDTTSKGTITPDIPSEALAEVAIVTKTAPLIESGLGFASKKNKIKIIENNQKARKQSIIKAIDKYRKQLEDELNGKPISQRTRVVKLENKINYLQKELTLLKERENHYFFDGKSLVLYVSNFATENAIMVYEDKYYLKRDDDFFSLTIAKQQQFNKKVIDETLVEVLNNLYSD